MGKIGTECVGFALDKDIYQLRLIAAITGRGTGY